MSRPPQTTLILANLASHSLVGIDTHFFTVNDLLRGIKLVPEGYHFFHYSESADTGESMRYGKWFQCSDGDILSVDMTEDSCQITANVNPPPTLSDDYAYMVKYPDNQAWNKLTSFVDQEAIDEYVPQSIPVSTATPLKEENMVLLETLRARNPSQTFADQEGKELNYTILQFRLAGPIAGNIEAATTRNSLDKSWYLTQLFGHDPELLLAELQLAFVHFVVLGNLCSCTQWLALARLVLMSPSYLGENGKFAQSFLALLCGQLDKLPTEYLSSVGFAVVDMKEYLAVMENLSYIFVSDATWEGIRRLNRAKFDIDLSFEKRVDAENFEVFDLDDYDELDEDAPAVVM